MAAPAGSQFKAYTSYIVQDLVIRTHVVEYRCERWVTPDGTGLTAPLPEGIQGHFGSDLRRFILAQYYQGQVTVPRLVEILQTLGVFISESLRAEIAPHVAGRVAFFLAACRHGGLPSDDATVPTSNAFLLGTSVSGVPGILKLRRARQASKAGCEGIGPAIAAPSADAAVAMAEAAKRTAVPPPTAECWSQPAVPPYTSSFPSRRGSQGRRQAQRASAIRRVARTAPPGSRTRSSSAMVTFWIAVLAISILLYVCSTASVSASAGFSA